MVPYKIRPLTPDDEPLLWEMVYLAIHVPSGMVPPPREVIFHPMISRYVRGWGRPGDYGVGAVTLSSGQLLGAAWLRLLSGENRGFGYVDDETPELTVALQPAFRGSGIGTELLTQLLEGARSRFQRVSLSVARDNPALRLYQRLGFEVVGGSDTSWTMVKRWDASQGESV